MKNKPTVPEQKQGAKKDIEHTVAAIDETASREIFMVAMNRLVDVNHWHEWSGPASATFRLTDVHGIEVNRVAQKDDYFKINIPAPGSAEGKGYDWVKIESIEDNRNPNRSQESFAMRVRPAHDPTIKGENVAHFFSESSTSSFVIQRNGIQVTAAVYGRNETPNTDTSNIIDKVRNTVVAITAILGFSNIQWKNLVIGLLTNNH